MPLLPGMAGRYRVGCYTTRRRASLVVIGLWALILSGDAQDAQRSANRSQVMILESAVQVAKNLLKEIDYSIFRLGKPVVKAVGKVGQMSYFQSYPRLGVMGTSGASTDTGTADIAGDGEGAPAPPPPTAGDVRSVYDQRSADPF